MATLIAVFNIKGGVGKSTSAVNLAYLAAQSGKKTLIWDMDHQGAAGFFLNTDDKLKAGLKGLVKDAGSAKDSKLASRIIATDYENLDLLPSDSSLRELDIKVAEAKGSKKFVAKLLAPIADDYDMIFIDCPPGLTVANESVLNAVDLVLVPTIPTVLSIRMLNELSDYIKDNIKEAPKLRAFFTMLDGRKNMHKAIYEQFCVKRKTLMFSSTIPYSSIAEKMANHRKPLDAFAASSKPALAYQELWASLKRLRF